MIRGILTFFSFASVIFFPWPFAATLAVVSAFVEPLMPLAVGIFADTFYYTPHANTLPLFTIYGAGITGVALVVRSRMRASIMR